MAAVRLTSAASLMAAAPVSDVTNDLSAVVSSSVSGALMVSVLRLPSQLTLSRMDLGTLLRSGFSGRLIATGRTTMRPAWPSISSRA